MSFISAMDIINIEIKVRKVEQIMEKIQDMDLRKMLLELEEKLQRVYGNKLKAVILYGSVARGTATEESDIDIMVLVDGTAQELRTFEDQLSDVSTDISIKYFKVFSELKGDYKDAFRKINVYRKDLYNYFAAKKIGNKLVCNRYDAVYTNTRMSSMGSWIAQRLQIPHIIHIREFGNKNTYWGPSNLKRINKTSNRVIVISKALAKEIEKAVEKSKMVISYDGVIYQGKEKQKSDEYVDILLTGRITEAKSQEEAVMAIAELKKRGYAIKKAKNDVLDGIRFVASLLNQGKIAISDQCPNTIKEFGSYIWDQKASERGEDKPVKQHDHAMDALRYFCYTIIRKPGSISILK